MSLYERLRLRLREPEVILPIYIVVGLTVFMLLFKNAETGRVYNAAITALFVWSGIIAVKFIRRSKTLLAYIVPAGMTFALYAYHTFVTIMYAVPISTIIQGLPKRLLSSEYIAPLVACYIVITGVLAFKLITKKIQSKKSTIPC
jgi:hypothetical protein